MIPPTPTTLTTMPGSKAKIGFSIDSIVGEEVSKSTTTPTRDRNDKYVNDYQTEITRALRLSADSFNADGHMKFCSDLNGTTKDVRRRDLFGYSMKRESSLSPLAPYQTTQTALPSEENSMRKSPRSPSPNQTASALTNNNNTSSTNNNNNNNNLHTSGSNTNNNEPPVVPPLVFTVSVFVSTVSRGTTKIHHKTHFSQFSQILSAISSTRQVDDDACCGIE